MAFKQLELKGKLLGPQKATIEPDFESKTVLVSDTWEYVRMWLMRRPAGLWARRHDKDDALLYWSQSRHFFDASRDLPNTSSPLTLYYCFLNAAKALLAVRGLSFSETHGVAGHSLRGKASLGREIVTFQAGGVLAALCGCLHEPTGGSEHSLKDLLYNLPYIHRAYNLTYTTPPELFVPLIKPRFVRKLGSNEAWFCGNLEERDATLQSLTKLPSFERDDGVKDAFVIRKKKRFKWVMGAAHRAKNVQELVGYHRKIRETLYYIHGPTRLWYLKRGGNVKGLIRRSSLTITFAAMHRMSEMARYTPSLLARHFDCQHNWLLSEFIATARSQFIDEISSEITGQEFMIPDEKASHEILSNSCDDHFRPHTRIDSMVTQW